MKKVDTESEFRNKIILGLELVYQRLIEYKKQKKSEFVISKNGKVVRVKPEDMPS